MLDNNNNRPGFTIIELVVIIAVIGILSSITMVSYNTWRQSAIAAQLKSDLNGAVAAMENARNFGSGYPISVPSTFTPSSNVVFGGGSYDGKTYCLYAINSQFPTLSYHIDSTDSQTSKSGICNADYPPPNTPTITVALNGNNVRATINAAVTCPSGTAQYSFHSRINDGAWGSDSAWAATPLYSQQVANDGVKYGYQAQARCYVSPTIISTNVSSSEGTYTDSNTVHTDYTVKTASTGCESVVYTDYYTHNGWTITAVDIDGSSYGSYSLDGGVGVTSVRGVAYSDCYYTSSYIRINSVTYHHP